MNSRALRSRTRTPRAGSVPGRRPPRPVESRPLVRQGIAVSGDERIVEAARAGVVADVEVRTELRRRQVEFAADGVVARADRQQHERAAGKKRCGRRPDALNQKPGRREEVRRSAFSRVSARRPSTRPARTSRNLTWRADRRWSSAAVKKLTSVDLSRRPSRKIADG